jgi:hypothetical protein
MDDKIIISGLTEEGKPFRPSAWAEMVSSSLATFGRDNRLKYDRGVHPCVIDGTKCLVIARDLQDKDPDAYDHVIRFAEQNKLQILRDRRSGERALSV